MQTKPPPKWRAGYATVKIVRFPWDPQDKPWGLVLDDETMRFRECAPGSIAADEFGLQSYRGKELASIDGRPAGTCTRNPGKSLAGDWRGIGGGLAGDCSVGSIKQFPTILCRGWPG